MDIPYLGVYLNGGSCTLDHHNGGVCTHESGGAHRGPDALDELAAGLELDGLLEFLQSAVAGTSQGDIGDSTGCREHVPDPSICWPRDRTAGSV